VRPIFHLSVPVRDLDEAVDFYGGQLDAEIGRRTAEFADALVFGAQVTLQKDPDSVTSPMPRTRHFGATVQWDRWELIATRFGGGSTIVEPPTVSYEGEPNEQGKLMIVDPSGNLIEIKAYRQPGNVLGPLAD
jgi:extradiol dioxygenase family protein